MQVWRCENCGYVYDGDILEVCPSCNKSCGFIDAVNYVPESFVGNERGSCMADRKDVTVYCDPFCPSCKDIADFLEKNKVVFRFVDVGSDDGAMKDVVALSGQNKLPVVEVGDEVLTPPIDMDELLNVINR